MRMGTAQGEASVHRRQAQDHHSHLQSTAEGRQARLVAERLVSGELEMKRPDMARQRRAEPNQMEAEGASNGF